MTPETGNKIKEARTAAGMTQTEVAKAAEGVSLKTLSKAERGMGELTPEQLEAVAKAIGVPAASLSDIAPAETKTSADGSVSLTPEEQELLTLFRAADAGKQDAAISVFKDEQLIPLFMNMLPELLKDDNAKELFLAMKSMVLASKVEDLVKIAKGLLSNKNGFMGAFMSSFGRMNTGASNTGASGSGPADIPAGINNGKEISVPLLAFTYFYSASIYILLLSFYFWLWRTDIKPEK